jgi:ribosomal protein L40E
MRARTLLAIAVVAVLGFTVATLVMYHGRPTSGAVFLTMGWMSILATGYFLARAVSFDFAVGAEAAGDVTAQRREELDREKKLLLKAIKEVEFDRDTGKLDDGEAAQAIARYRARAVEILRQLDDSKAPQIEAKIEAELARRLAEARGCTKCGITNDEDAAFCKKCGAKIA